MPKENSPIVPGEMFSPEAGALDVRRTKSTDRKAKLQEFKEKYIFQKEGLGKLQEILTREIRKRPNIERGEFIKAIDKASEILGLTEEQRKKAKLVVGMYMNNHTNIEALRRLYVRDDVLFRKIFHVEPQGKVEVLQTPFLLYFRLLDPRDYANLHSGAFLKKRRITIEELERADKSGAHLVTTLNNLTGLAGSIAAENSSKIGSINREEVMSEVKNLPPATTALPDNKASATMLNVLPSRRDIDKQVNLFMEIRVALVNNNLVHEESHAIKRLFGRGAMNEQIAYHPAESKNDEKVEISIKRYLRQRREFGEELAKDELIAYLKHGGLAPHQIFELLSAPKEKGGIYDYFAEVKKDAENALCSTPEDIGYLPLIDKNIKKVFEDEYFELLENGIDAFLHLKEAGYVPEKIAALLITEPLAKWKRVAERLTNKKLAPRHLPFRLFGDVQFEVVPPDDESSPS